MIWQWDGRTEYMNLSHDMGIRGTGEYVAVSDDLAFGKDFFSIENAYGWLYTGNIFFFTKRYREALMRLMVILVLPAGLRTVSIAMFWSRARTFGAKIIAAIATAGIFLSYAVNRVSIDGNAGTKLYIFDMCVVVEHIFVYWIHTFLSQNEIIEERRDRVKLLIAIFTTSFLISLTPQIKFSCFPVTIALLIILGTILLIRKKYIELICWLSSFIIFSCGLWVMTGERLEYLWPYVSSQLKWATTGYSEVMSLSLYRGPGTVEDFIFAIFICFIYTAVLIYLLRKDQVKALSWFIVAPLIYIDARYAFTRSDSIHTKTFMINLVYIIAFYLLLIIQEIENQRPDSYYKETFCKINSRFWPAILVLLLLPSITNRGWYPITTIGTDFNALGSFEKYKTTKEANANILREDKICSTLYKNILPYPDKTIGMLCNETMFIFAYDLLDRYEIIPYGGLWESFSSESELMMANHYYSNEAPELVIHSYQTYNERYMTTYMGTIFQALIENYHVDTVDENGYVILLQNDIQKHEICELGESQIISIGDVIEIPKVENAYVFMKVDWKLTPFGNIAKTFLKPTKAFIEFTMDSGEVFKTNFFRTLSENGIYVSSIATSTQEWAEIINGNTENKSVKNIKFEADEICYNQQFQVSFYAVPYTQAQMNYISIK